MITSRLIADWIEEHIKSMPLNGKDARVRIMMLANHVHKRIEEYHKNLLDAKYFPPPSQGRLL